MAITFRGIDGEGLTQLTNLLKIWYKDGVTNLLYRNSPLLKMIKKERVEGSEQDFNALYGRGGAVSANFKYASEGAAETVRDAVFKITPGQIFSCYTITAKEIVAAKTQRGAFMPIAGAKMFTATEAFRKTIAGALYGMGYGELAYVTTGADSESGVPYVSPDTPNTILFYDDNSNKTNASSVGDGTHGQMYIPLDAVMKIDVNSRLKLKTSISGIESKDSGGVLKVTRIGSTKLINGVYCNLVDFDVSAGGSNLWVASTTYVLALRGGTDSQGEGKDPWFPVGLSGWLPYVSKRDGVDWSNYISESFMGVVRNVSIERLSGQFVIEDDKKPAAGGSKTPIADTILALMDMCRTAGSTADMIVMNNKDYQALGNELTPYQTGVYFSDIKNKGKNTPTIGMSDIQVGFSTSWLDKVIDDPYCPRGVVYILDSELTKLWTYTNVDNKLQNDGVPGNEPGKPDVMSEQSDSTPEKPYQLLLDDLMTVDQGDDTVDGAAARITINFFGSFVLLDPAVGGAAILCNKATNKAVDDTTHYGYYEPIGSKLYVPAT
jgi:hypothetical protein